MCISLQHKLLLFFFICVDDACMMVYIVLTVCIFIANTPVSADQFNYTCMGGETEIQGVDDRADMAETCRTFTLLGDLICFISSMIDDLFRMCCIALYCSNLFLFYRTE